jgi:hypothetical protein
MLDLMQPFGASGRAADKGWLARADEAGGRATPRARRRSAPQHVGYVGLDGADSRHGEGPLLAPPACAAPPVFHFENNMSPLPRRSILRCGSVLAILGVFMTLVRLTVFMAAGTLLAGLALIAIASFVGL